MAKKLEIINPETGELEKKTKNQVLDLQGLDYIKIINKLYDELGKEIASIKKDKDETAKQIINTFNMQLAFIKEAWSDQELTKEEKSKIYDNYMDTSKVLQQYLLDKEKHEAAKLAKKEKGKDIAIGAVIVTVCLTAIVKAVEGAANVYSKFKG